MSLLTPAGGPADALERSARPRITLRGFSPTLLAFEAKRALRNRRILLFTVVFPVVMFLLVSSRITGSAGSMGPAVANVGAYVMVSMALYGSVVSATSAGASVSVERASGWSRQLLLTPLRPVAYVLAKMLTAVLLAVVAVTATFAAGSVSGRAQLLGHQWPELFAIVVLGSLIFAAFGLFMGYLLPGENVMQVLGPVIGVLSLVGGIFFPIDETSMLGEVARITPIYGLSEIAHWPLTETATGTHAPFQVLWLVNLTAWGLVFVAGAAWRMRRDTARV